jgi:hypothetical protein
MSSAHADAAQGQASKQGMQSSGLQTGSAAPHSMHTASWASDEVRGAVSFSQMHSNCYNAASKGLAMPGSPP